MKKCICLLVSVFCGIICVFARASSENQLFAIKVGFQMFVKVMVVSMFLKMVKCANSLDVRVFVCVLSVLLQKLSE